MANGSRPADPLVWPSMRGGVLLRVAALVLLAGVFVTGAVPAGAQSSPAVTSTSLQAPTAYTPHPPNGGTDDYHCTLLNPHVKQNSFIVSSHFYPNSVEVHHAILFLVPPALAAQAEAANTNGQGWTCFGETALPGADLSHLNETPWLSAWAPGHGEDVLPAGTGQPLPAGSLVVMQIHYNLLLGDKPVRAKLVLHTVPGTTPLRPLSLALLPAPPDIPCPAGVTGSLCNRNASLADLGQRFGEGAVGFVNTLETICGRNPANPPAGDSTSCTLPVMRAGTIVRVGAHMHLLGRALQMVLNPGTPSQKTILNVANYNFHYQRAYDLSKPIAVVPGDSIQVTCTYDPTLRQELPTLRNLPPRFVTWGDGSSDEMCLGLVETVPPAGSPGAIGWPSSVNSGEVTF
jgi:Copper type II ascorbate-dependent monooxygenase, C-terminal domain